MNSIYIYKQYYHVIQGSPNEELNNYTLEIYKDLVLLENNDRIKININASRPFSTIELCEDILNECYNDGNLQDIDLFITVNCGHEYDPVKVGPLYFLNKYKINPFIFNIFDQGIIAPVTAMKIIQSFMHFSEVKKSLLLCYDNISDIINYDYKIYKPIINSARIIILHSCIMNKSLYEVKKIKINEDAYKFINSHLNDKDSITMTVDNNCYSCPEIFNSIFNEKHNINKNNINLIIKDDNSEETGVIELRKLYQ